MADARRNSQLATAIFIQPPRKSNTCRMAQRLKIETGLEFFGRIQPRPTLQNLDAVLFPDGVSNNDTIEIRGNSSNWNSLLLTQLIAKCILPTEHEGQKIDGINVRVLLLNTNHSFLVSRLEKTIESILSKNENLDSRKIDNITKRSLNNLIVINCYSSFQYLLTLKSLGIIISSEKIDLVAIDSINAYYWEDRKNGGRWTMSSYVKNILMSVQKHTHHWNNVFIYSQINNFHNKSNHLNACLDKAEEKIHHRVNIDYCNKTNKYTCSIESRGNNFRVDYPILLN
ncbi:X-ray repair cross complementing 2 [Cotesia typhae]|uniref:X-ray repair cross complementing 2 n=1 Tax=Cotesia typhae TaxID=2053667 RepID=UPI003D6806D3